jgi:hypothetical protein
LNFTAGAKMRDRILDDVLKAQENSNKTIPVLKEPNVRRIIMKSPIIKLAAAAVIIVAVLIGLNPFKDTITFADVIKPILNARTVVLDYVIGEGPDALEMHDIVIGSRIRRTISNIDMTTILDSRVRRTLSNMDMIMILDLEDARMLTLENTWKIASYIDIQGTGQESLSPK